MKKLALSAKKYFALVIMLTLLCSVLLPAFTFRKAKAFDNNTLRIYNWEDYMDTDFILGNSDDGIVGAFIEYCKDTYNVDVNVEYMTFGTNEIMYNNMKINGETYDLICPSDYMIEKMARENMLEKLDPAKLADYYANVSPYIQNTVFNDITWENANGDAESLADYATGYMWGTMGLLYNAENVPDFDMSTWRTLWDVCYANRCTIKDSVRDSYFIGVAYVYKAELVTLAEEYADGTKTLAEYQAALKELFNRTDDDTIAAVENIMKSLKKNIYGFEVDSGKSDVASGKIDVNFAWSGDAAYAMDQGDEVDRELKYYVPDEGSNVWFDGWVIPKGANKDLAYEFINFLARPEISARNMEYIGYTSATLGISGDSFSIEHEDDDGNPVVDNYADMLDWIKQTYELKDISELEADDGYDFECDISYLFGNPSGTDVLYTDEEYRQFMTTFPTEDVINRCSVMQYFDGETNIKISEMWERVKGSTLPAWVIAIIIVAVVLLILGVIAFRYKLQIADFIENMRNKRGGKGGKGKKNSAKKPKVVSVEEV